MNVLIFIPELSHDWGGVRQYTLGLLKILAQDPTNTYYIYHKTNDAEIGKLLAAYPQLRLICNDDEYYTPATKALVFLKRGINFLSRKLRLNYSIQINDAIDKICEKHSIDIIHCPYQYIPVTKRAKLIPTLHDVQEIHFPEYFTPQAIAHRKVTYTDFINRAHAVVVSYNHVKQDLVTYYKTNPDKVHVILLDMQNLWFEAYTEKDAESLGHLHLPEKFLLYPANTWKHKNHLRVIEALKYLSDKHGTQVNIVFTGHQNEHYTEISKRVRELGIGEQVHFLGNISNTLLYTLYKECYGVVVPTTYEAGSFPLMESMLLGVPVICSNVTSLPETIGHPDFVFDPFSVENMGTKILELWTSEEFRLRALQNSRAESKKLTNNKALLKFQQLYQTVSG
jgi:glycosyltransferase involved in cell wall biosynthesis